VKKLLEFLVTSIVEHPKEVVIEESEENGQINLGIKVHPDDIKIVIGKQGKTIRALRELVKIKAIKESKKVSVNLSEDSQQKPQ
jgi:predicted RNA-binding protein YlqC (UPF0109 family)